MYTQDHKKHIHISKSWQFLACQWFQSPLQTTQLENHVSCSRSSSNRCAASCCASKESAKVLQRRRMAWCHRGFSGESVGIDRHPAIYSDEKNRCCFRGIGTVYYLVYCHHIWLISGQDLHLKFNAMSPIRCEDFSIPGGITNGVSV